MVYRQAKGCVFHVLTLIFRSRGDKKHRRNIILVQNWTLYIKKHPIRKSC